MPGTQETLDKRSLSPWDGPLGTTLQLLRGFLYFLYFSLKSQNMLFKCYSTPHMLPLAAWHRITLSFISTSFSNPAC